MDANWAIGGGVVASIITTVIAHTILQRQSRADKNSSDLTSIQTLLEERERRYEIEHRAIEHRLKGLERRDEVLGKRYHNLRVLVLECLVRLGVKRREHDLEDDGERGEND